MGWFTMTKDQDGYNQSCIYCGLPLRDQDKYYWIAKQGSKPAVAHAACAWKVQDEQANAEKGK